MVIQFVAVSAERASQLKKPMSMKAHNAIQAMKSSASCSM
jgi:hypothetical protein